MVFKVENYVCIYVKNEVFFHNLKSRDTIAYCDIIYKEKKFK